MSEPEPVPYDCGVQGPGIEPTPDPAARSEWIARFVAAVRSLDPNASEEAAAEIAGIAWSSTSHLDPQQAAMHYSRGHSTSPQRSGGSQT